MSRLISLPLHKGSKYFFSLDDLYHFNFQNGIENFTYKPYIQYKHIYGGMALSFIIIGAEIGIKRFLIGMICRNITFCRVKGVSEFERNEAFR